MEERLASLRNVTHPYLVRVAHSGVRDGSAFYVVDAAPHRALGEYLADQRGGKLDPERAFDMLLPVGQAVLALHQSGLVHGDVSARAIRVEEATERTFLGTFPLAAVLGIQLPPPPFRELQETRSAGALLDGPKASQADDVRGFASVLYQALTGTPVAPGSTPPPPSSRCALPAEADDILLAALDPDPAQRTKNLAEVLQGLQPLKAAIAEVARAARAGRSRSVPAPALDSDRRAGKERRGKGRRKDDFESLPFMDKLAVWLFDKGPAVNFLVFAAIAFASFRSAFLVPAPPELMSGEFQSKAVSIASGKFDAEKIQDDLVQAAALAASKATTPADYEARFQALRRFAKAVRKEERDKVLDEKSAARLRLTYTEDRAKACAMLDVLLKRAHEFLQAQEQARKTAKGAGG